MQFIDLSVQRKRIKNNINNRIKNVLEHGKYIMGPEVIELENRLAEYTGTAYGIGCASGTDALLISLMAHNIGPGDAIFTSPFTFIATAEVIKLLGATPIFVDISQDTFNMDPEKLKKAIKALNKKNYDDYPLPRDMTTCLHPKGVIAVDLFGLPADYDTINSIAKENDLFVIEDAAQSFGGGYKGRKAGSLASIGCTSFFPAKPLGCYGDGGMCFTDDKTLAEAMRSIRIHGKGTDKYDNIRTGINGRLDTLQAAILLAKFEIFSEEVQLRNLVAKRYSENLQDANALITPAVPKGYMSVWAQYSLLAENMEQRAKYQETLRTKNIPTAVYYPKPLHLQTAFRSLGYSSGDFPMSERCSDTIFSLPMYPYLDQTTQMEIISVLKNA